MPFVPLFVPAPASQATPVRRIGKWSYPLLVLLVLLVLPVLPVPPD